MTSKGEAHAGASGKHGSAKPGAFGGRILKLLTHPRVLLVLFTVSLWAYYIDSIQKTFPFLLTAQLKFHQILSNLEPWQSVSSGRRLSKSMTPRFGARRSPASSRRIAGIWLTWHLQPPRRAHR